MIFNFFFIRRARTKNSGVKAAGYYMVSPIHFLNLKCVHAVPGRRVLHVYLYPYSTIVIKCTNTHFFRLTLTHHTSHICSLPITVGCVEHTSTTINPAALSDTYILHCRLPMTMFQPHPPLLLPSFRSHARDTCGVFVPFMRAW